MSDYNEQALIDMADRCREAATLQKDGMTLRQIGKKLGVSPERARQMCWRGARYLAGKGPFTAQCKAVTVHGRQCKQVGGSDGLCPIHSRLYRLNNREKVAETP